MRALLFLFLSLSIPFWPLVAQAKSVWKRSRHFHIYGPSERVEEMSQILERSLSEICQGLFIPLPRKVVLKIRLTSSSSLPQCTTFLKTQSFPLTLSLPEKERRFRLYRAVVHHLVHRLLQQNYPHIAPWLSEGLALYWSTCLPQLSQKKLTFALIAYSHLHQLFQTKFSVELGDFVDLSPRLYMAKDWPQRRALSWLFVHYSYEKERKKLKKLLRAFRRTEKVYYSILLGKLSSWQTRLKKYAQKLLRTEGQRFYQKGKGLYKKKKYREAIQELNRTLVRNPYHTSARFLRALCHLAQKNPKGALADFLFLADLALDEPKIYYYIAKIHMSEGYRNRAKPFIRQAFELAPQDRAIEELYRKVWRKKKK